MAPDVPQKSADGPPAKQPPHIAASPDIGPAGATARAEELLLLGRLEEAADAAGELSRSLAQQTDAPDALLQRALLVHFQANAFLDR
jgi:hypothetical protein